jgi:protein SCO1/2
MNRRRAHRSPITGSPRWIHPRRAAPRNTVLALAAFILGTAPRAQAQSDPAPAGARAERIGDVDIVESLNEPVPAEATFTDAEGRKVRLGDLLGGEKPVLLTLVYYQCPTLCSLVLGGLNKAVRNSGLDLGQDYRAVTISIDPRETAEMARDRQRGHLQALGAPDRAADWAFLVGEEPEVKKVAGAVGFKYRYDAASRQYAHAAAVVVLTPEGRVSRYLYGFEFPPRDVKFALLEAAGGRIGTSLDRVVLTCFKYDPNTRRYELYIFGFIRGGALLVFSALAAALAVLWRREHKRGTIR